MNTFYSFVCVCVCVCLLLSYGIAANFGAMPGRCIRCQIIPHLFYMFIRARFRQPLLICLCYQTFTLYAFVSSISYQTCTCLFSKHSLFVPSFFLLLGMDYAVVTVGDDGIGSLTEYVAGSGKSKTCGSGVVRGVACEKFDQTNALLGR
jgi:hypothetical protein